MRVESLGVVGFLRDHPSSLNATAPRHLSLSLMFTRRAPRTWAPPLHAVLRQLHSRTFGDHVVDDEESILLAFSVFLPMRV